MNLVVPSLYLKAGTNGYITRKRPALSCRKVLAALILEVAGRIRTDDLEVMRNREAQPHNYITDNDLWKILPRLLACKS